MGTGVLVGAGGAGVNVLVGGAGVRVIDGVSDGPVVGLGAGVLVGAGVGCSFKKIIPLPPPPLPPPPPPVPPGPTPGCEPQPMVKLDPLKSDGATPNAADSVVEVPPKSRYSGVTDLGGKV